MTFASRMQSGDDARWAAVVTRDPQADFTYAVVTTGVYCRPSCGARLARRENVRFFATGAEAQRAGFRPCKRCRPDGDALAERRAAAVLAACRTIDDAGQPPTLQSLADAAGMSRYHFHRVFKAMTGLTPRAYAAARRAHRVREGLTAADTVTSAIYDAGFNSTGRFYAESNRMLGMTPGRFRRRGRGESIRFAVGQCSLGAILVAATVRGICAIWLGDEPEALVRGLQDRFADADLQGGDAAFERLVATVVGFVEAPETGLSLPLDVRGTALQQKVWHALQQIPPGATATYKEIAERVGSPRAVRAVARACAANSLAVAIPCHRVVRTDGSPSGYRWGIERKKALLEREVDVGTPHGSAGPHGGSHAGPVAPPED